MADTTLSVSPATPVPPLPVPGNLQAQLQQAAQLQAVASKAQALIQSGGDASAQISSLAAAGITLASGFVPGGAAGTMVRTIVNLGAGAASGAAVGGPFGAAVGLLGSLAQSLFGGGPPAFQGIFVDMTPGSQRLFQLLTQWGQQNGGALSGKPQGQSFAEYLLYKYPPSTTLRPRRMYWMAGQSGAFAQDSMGAIVDPHQVPQWPLAPDSQALAGEYASTVVGIDASLLWEWAQPQGSAVTSPDTWASAYSAPSEVTTMDNLSPWYQDTPPFSAKGAKMSRSQIMANALRCAPDPMYFAQDLYVVEWSLAGESGVTIEQTALACGVATVCGMLAVGASPLAIARELSSLQQTLYSLDQTGVPLASYIAQLEADLDPANLASAAAAGHPYTRGQVHALKTSLASAKAGHLPSPVPDAFRLLVEDYIALAHLEKKHGTKASMRDVILANRPDELPIGAKPPPPPPPPTAQAQGKAGIQHWMDHYLRGGAA